MEAKTVKPKNLFTSKEVAGILKVTRNTLYKIEKRKEIASCCTVGRDKYFTRDAIKKYFDQFPPEIWQEVEGTF